MTLRRYFFLWVAATLVMSFEYWALKHYGEISLLRFLQNHLGLLSNTKLSTEAGRSISYFLGWLGMGIILVTNLYLLRKNWSPLKNLGSLQNWLNFHIFCGLLGPTCILFHSDFQVRGVVGISFWCMIIVVISGVIGRYVYSQVLQYQVDAEQGAKTWEDRIEAMRAQAQREIPNETVDRLKLSALHYVGVLVDAGHSEKLPLFIFPRILGRFLIGDLRLSFAYPHSVPELPENSRHALACYALVQRRQIYLESFRRVLGYWHIMHLPFTVSMYGAAFIHIVVALMFGT
jgi:hypothetical protein